MNKKQSDPGYALFTIFPIVTKLDKKTNTYSDERVGLPYTMKVPRELMKKREAQLRSDDVKYEVTQP